MLVIGRALMCEPKVILLDEPSLGLGTAAGRGDFRYHPPPAEERGLTVLLVEQNAALALDIADHGYVMENGRIVLEGPADALRQNSDIKEFYLGLNEAGARKSYRDPSTTNAANAGCRKCARRGSAAVITAISQERVDEPDTSPHCGDRHRRHDLVAWGHRASMCSTIPISGRS